MGHIARSSFVSNFLYTLSGPLRKSIMPASVSRSGLKRISFAIILWICIICAAPPVLTAEEQGQGPLIMSPHDFIENSLMTFRERLNALKKLYENQYGSIFAATSPTDIETIAKELPKPTTLRLAIQYPQLKEETEKKAIVEKGDYFADNMSAGADIDPLFNLTGGYYTGRYAGDNLVSADPITGQLLGIPQKVRLLMSAGIRWTSSERSSTRGESGEVCCTSVGKQEYCAESSTSYPYRCIKKGYYDYCAQFAQLPHVGFTWDDPRRYAGELGLRADRVQGVSIDDRFKSATFTAPGKKVIALTSPRKFSSDEQYAVYRSCIPKFSYRYYGSNYYSTTSQGMNRAVAGYRPAGNVTAELRFNAIAFKKFGFPGFEIDASYGQVPNLDFFYDPKTSALYGGNYAGGLVPVVLADYGDAGGLKAVNASSIHAPVTWSTISPGPFSVNDAGVSYQGGIGATKFRVTLGGYESVEHTLTANVIEVALDASMKRGEIAPGKAHKVTVRVKGPADLTRYQVRLNAEGATWKQSVASFAKVGEVWEASGTLSALLDGQFQRNKLRQPVTIKAEVVRTVDSAMLYTYENSRLSTTYPAIKGLELYAGTGSKEPEKVTGPFDIFTHSEIESKVTLSPRVVTYDGGTYSAHDVSPRSGIEISSSNPGSVYVIQQNVTLRSGTVLRGSSIVALPGERVGTSKITARIGGGDIDMAEYAQFAGDQKEITSDPVVVNLNTPLLMTEKSGAGRTTFKLIIIGSSDMSGYEARWTGEATRTTSFRKDQGGYSSSLDTTLRMDKVEIQRSGSVVARFSIKGTARKIDVRLLPPKAPVATVQKVEVTDLGNLETITQCKKNVSLQMESLGMSPGTSPEEYCKAKREKDKETILTQREDQKAFNKMLSNLNKQGQDLVVVSDTMRVGAAVKGDITSMGDTPFCYWSLQNAGALTLEYPVTPIETMSANEGGCFNIVKGLKGGFNPDAMIKVDLVVPPRPAAPLVTTGGRVVATGGSLFQ